MNMRDQVILQTCILLAERMHMRVKIPDRQKLLYGTVKYAVYGILLGGFLGAALGEALFRTIIRSIYMGGILGAILVSCCKGGILEPLIGAVLGEALFRTIAGSSYMGGILGAMLGYFLESRAMRKRIYNPRANLVIKFGLNETQKGQFLAYVRDFFEEMQLQLEWNTLSELSQHTAAKNAIIRGMITFFKEVMAYDVYYGDGEMEGKKTWKKLKEYST